jgi:hypothetical protein
MLMKPLAHVAHVVLPPLTALFTLACSHQIRPGTPGCRVEGLSAQEEVAMNSACAAAREHFAALTGLPAAPLRLQFQDANVQDARIDGDTVIVRLPTPAHYERMGASVGMSSAPVGKGWTDMVATLARHEGGHALLAAALHDSVAGVRGKRYGTRLPDWFDEAVAQWSEPDALRAQRLAQAPAFATEVSSLKDFISKPQPYIAQEAIVQVHEWVRMGPCQGDCGPNYRAGTRTVYRSLFRDGSVRAETTWAGPGVVSAAREGEIFYPVSLSLVTFIHQRFGSEGTRRLTAALVRGETSEAALGALMPAGGFDAFEQAWRSWLRKRTP